MKFFVCRPRAGRFSEKMKKTDTMLTLIDKKYYTPTAVTYGVQLYNTFPYLYSTRSPNTGDAHILVNLSDCSVLFLARCPSFA